jgi:hypothetical protein
MAHADEPASASAPASAPGGKSPAELAKTAAILRSDLVVARASAIGPGPAEPGTKDQLTEIIDGAEREIEKGDLTAAAAQLLAALESPRFKPLDWTPEYQTAEYDLLAVLVRDGAYRTSLARAEKIIARGPKATYFGPAHRRAVDVAIETHAAGEVLARLEGIKIEAKLPAEATAERAYLRGRAAYDEGKLDVAEYELAKIGRADRLYAQAVYVRGVIRVRQKRFAEAAADMCLVAGPQGDEKLGYIVDGRWFALRDLATLGAARIAHEVERYDDAWIHDFTIPEDSEKLPDALFEAAWSMYQKRELATARELVRDFIRSYPHLQRTPEALLLAGYIELADCKLPAAKADFDRVEAEVVPLAKADVLPPGFILPDPTLARLEGMLGSLKLDAEAGAPKELVDREAMLETDVAIAVDLHKRKEEGRARASINRVVEKARLGKVDAVLAEKRKLEREIEAINGDHWSPPKLGTALEAGMVGDTNEYWPPEDEVWKDELKGWK